MTTAEGTTQTAEHRTRADLFGPGWIPAGIAWVLVSAALWSSGVSLVDIARFSGYLAFGLALPGTLLWRFVAGDRPRPFVSDVVFGTCLAYAVELFWYVGVRAAGVPVLVLAWPVLVVGASLLPRWRARLWRPRDVHRMPAAWSWGMTALVLLACAHLAHTVWPTTSLDDIGLRSPRPDMPYHLSLVAELRHHLPAASPIVDGEPLYYHWFLHAEMAATSWATGIEPVLLLQRLSLAPMIVLTLMGAGLLAGRLTGSARWGLLASALLVVGGVTSMVETPWSEQADLWLNGRMYVSPTTTFAQLLLVPVLALGMRLLRADVPAPWRLWVTMAVLLSALSASKATALPFVMAGFLGVFLIAAVGRRLERRALALFTMCAVVFLVARRLIYGNEARGVRWDPLVFFETQAAEAGLADTAADAGLGLAVLMLVAYLLQQLTFAAGIVGLARRGHWRDPRAQFLVVAATAATVAAVTFAANSNSQMHFIRTAPVVFAIASAWGLSLLVPQVRPRWLPHLLGAAALVAAGLAMTLEALDGRGVIGIETQRSPWGLMQPYVLAAVGVLALAAAWAVVSRLRPSWRGTTAAVAVAGCAGLGLPSVFGLALDVVSDPVPPAYERPPGRPMIGVGGIEAARWLREHSDPDDLVATNRHCSSLITTRRCDNRMFWLSAHTERRILLEGWSYQVRTAPRAERLGVSACCLPFWDPDRLATNDAAFLASDADDVAALRDEFGVQWMMVDLRAPHRIGRLRQYAEQEFAAGNYVVLRLPATSDDGTRSRGEAG